MHSNGMADRPRDFNLYTTWHATSHRSFTPIQKLTTPSLIHLFDSRTSSSSSTWHTTAWHTTLGHARSSRRLVHLHHDRIDHTLQFFLPRFKLLLLGELVLLEPVQGLLDSFFNLPM